MSYIPPITVPTKSVPFIKSWFANYKRREVSIQPSTRVSFQDLNWSGGTRSEYTVVRLADDKVVSLASWSTVAPWNNPHEGQTVDLPPGFMIIRTGHFCGKVSMLRIYVHPDNLTKLLPTP